ncbi:MAG TPA: hypothetical protein DDY71_06550 [Spirochaetia bacterium]|nr:hypothetical protein [Spirochaetia bacterium]
MGSVTAVDGVPGTLPACGFTKTGMVFKGWATSAEGAPEYADKASVTINGSNITLYAKWGIYIPTYRVIYNGNGDEVTNVPADNTLYTNSMNVVVLDKGTMARAGYTFTGWNTKEDGTGTVRAVESNFVMGNANVILYAQWSAVSYTITYHLDGGTNHGDNPAGFTSETVLTLQLPTKDYYEFNGWYEDAAYSIPVAGIVKGTTGNKNYYAKWAAGTPKSISFDKNSADATGTMATVSGTGGVTVTLPECTFTRSGYTFKGWALTADGEIAYTDKASVIISDADIALYALWADSSVEYVISFNKNDLDAAGTMASVTAVNDVPVTLPACAFTKTGMVFKGWATSAEGAAEYADKTSVTTNGANITLYAKWGIYIPTYRVIYNGNGDGVTGVPTDNTLYTNSMNVVVLDKGAMARAENTFTGWNTKADGTGTARAVDTNFMMGNADVVLYAQWSAVSYTITYHLDGGANHGDNPANFTSETVLTLQSPSKDYHDFNGWYEDAAYSIPVTGIVKGTTGNKNFYAKWTLKMFSLSFEKNNWNASGTNNSMSIAYGDSVILNDNGFTLEGNVFIGWATNSNGAIVYREGDTFTMSGADVTLYAKWMQSSFTVDYITYTVKNDMTLEVTDCDELITGALVIPGEIQGLTVKFVGNYAFSNCTSLKTVTIPSSITTIGAYAFYNCTSLTGIEIPNSVTYIGGSAFYDCTSLTAIQIPDSVTSIYTDTFYKCSSLTVIEISNYVYFIDHSVFAYCRSLTAINVRQQNGYYSSINGVLFNKARSLLIAYPNGKNGAYSIPNTVKTIGNGAFLGSEYLTAVTIPTSVTSIESNAFIGCSSLTSAALPSTVSSIGERVFLNCSLLSTVNIPNGIKTIENSTFYNCSSLNSVNIPNTVTSIGYDAFYKCSSLTSVTIPGGVTSIGYQAFRDCSLLSIVNLYALTPPLCGNNVFYKTLPTPKIHIKSSASAAYGNLWQDCQVIADL